MQHKWKRLISYYRPYRGLFFSDMVFAILGAAVTLAIPLIVRYITTTVVLLPGEEALQIILRLGAAMVAMVALECFCNFYIAYYGHIMGAKIEHDMRNEIFEHYQKLSFTFFDNQKVGQLLSRITSDLFDISELLHHGPEDVTISLIKFIGSFLILVNINGTLTVITFAFNPGDCSLCLSSEPEDEARLQDKPGADSGYQRTDRGQLIWCARGQVIRQ